MTERRRLDEAITATREIERDLNDTSELIELAEAEGDEALAEDGVAALKILAAKAEKDKVAALLSGEADNNDTYIEINSGAGGTESQDWASMLLRMYQRWAEKHGYKVELIDFNSGEQAGIKNATILVKGGQAYGWAKTESGVHRLVTSAPMTVPRAATPALRRCGSIRRLMMISRSRSRKPICASTLTAPLAPAGSISTPPTAPSASPTCPPALLWPANQNAVSTRTVRQR
jgi:hypothetical protein